MRTRRSVRSFLPEDVPKAELKALFEVVRYAPTGRNAQNLWWIVTAGREQTLPLARLARQWMRAVMCPERADSDWPEDDDPVLRGAPHLILCCGPEDSRWGPTDAAIAVAHLELLAASRGLGACWAGAFVRAAEDFAPLQDALALPPGQRLYAGLFLGRPRHRHRLVPPRNPAAIDWR
jgi:nitroreductase